MEYVHRIHYYENKKIYGEGFTAMQKTLDFSSQPYIQKYIDWYVHLICPNEIIPQRQIECMEILVMSDFIDTYEIPLIYSDIIYYDYKLGFSIEEHYTYMMSTISIHDIISSIPIEIIEFINQKIIYFMSWDLEKIDNIFKHSKAYDEITATHPYHRVLLKQNDLYKIKQNKDGENQWI